MREEKWKQKQGFSHSDLLLIFQYLPHAYQLLPTAAIPGLYRALWSLLQRLFAWQEVFSLLSFSYNTTFYEDFPHFHRVILYAHASIVALLHCIKITCSCHSTTFMLQCLLNKQEFQVMGQSTKEMRQGNSLMYHMKQKSSLWFLSCSAFLCSWPHPALILISSSENYSSCFLSCCYICAQISY